VNLAEALTLPVNTTIASIECLIKSTITSFNTKKGSGSIYNISDIDNTCEGQLIVWSDDNKRLAENKRYKISSTVNKGKLSGLHIEKYKDYPSRISCKTNTLITTINNTKMDTIGYKPLNDKETLMNYYGKTYLEMRNKLSAAPDVSPDQAHQAAMDFVNWIPKSFFGDKPLP
jgi:hypothetical protein